MLHLNCPEIIEILNNNEFSKSEKLSRIGNKNTVVVSVIGCSDFHEEKTYKRAFRLIIDAFGSPKLFKSSSWSSSNSKSYQDDEGRSADPSGHDPSESGRGGGGRDEGQGVEQMTSSSGAGSSSWEERPLGSIDGFYSEEERILFLHLQGAYDPRTLLAEWERVKASMDTSSETNQGFSQIWAEIKSKYVRSLLLIFSLSHVILVSSTGSFFDTSYIHFFRILDTIRHEVLPFVSKLLGKIEGIPKPWKDHGRLCSPRILFMFQITSDRPARVALELPVQDHVKELQYKLEDEIYHALRKCRIVTNISANSLFAIPSSQEYVFIYDRGVQEPEMQDDTVSRLNHITSAYCEKMSAILLDPSSPDYKNLSKLTFASMFPTTYAANASKKPGEQLRTYRDLVEDFREFITAHTQLAHEKGFDDDSKHVAEHKHFFVMPTFTMWRKAFEALQNYFVRENHSDRRAIDALSLIHQFNNVDTEYLESQCAKMFPKAYSLYLKNLPEIYPEKVHKAKVSMAIDAFLKVTRGPGVRPWVKKLIEKCDRYWKRGHEQCEARSLYEFTCCHPLHRVKIEDHLEVIPLMEMDPSLPEMEHSTGHRNVSYCNCGHRQGSRDEPFTIREANFAFYDRLAKDCCDRLEKVEFLTFSPPAGYEKSTIHPQEMLVIYQQKLMGLLRHEEADYGQDSDEVEDELRQEMEGSSLSYDSDNEKTKGQPEAEMSKADASAPVELEQVSEKSTPDTATIRKTNIWSKAPIESDLLPRTELENEYIYKRIRERKMQEGDDIRVEKFDESKMTEYQAQVKEMADKLREDFKKGEDDRKEWLKWTGYEHKQPEFFDARAMKETLYKSFDSPMKTMALSMRFREGWEQRSKRLPEHIVNWVNDYAARRKLLTEQEEDEILAITLEPEEEEESNKPPEPEKEATSSQPATVLGASQPEVAMETHESQMSGQSTHEADYHLGTKGRKSGSQVSQESLQFQLEKLKIGAPAESTENRPKQRKTSEQKDEKQSGDSLSEVTVAMTTENAKETSRGDRAESKEQDSRRETPTPPAAADDNTMQYLPGMLHSRSLRGLYPLFSSWSLVCLGSSSLYTHSIGITHQPGFLPGSSTLLPWDKMVKAESGVTKPIPRLIRGRKPTGRAKRITDEFNVKVFVGTEYECKRGHRFLLEAPNKILQISGQHGPPNLKEAAGVVVGSDMPLYYRCPCKEGRDGSVSIAQLMRLHVVTPKAPVHVILNVRIQPGPSPCPIFSPETKEIIKLTPSSYWILRLPYCYVGDDQVYVPSKDVTRYNGRLLKGFVDVESMTQDETKEWEAQQNAA